MENIKDKLQKATTKSISSSVKNIFNTIKNNDSFFNDIKKVISQMISQLSIKNKKQNNEIHKLQKQVIKVLNTIKKSLQTEIQYEENQLSEITINAFLSNFKNQISNSLLEYTINIDKSLKKILQSNDKKDKNQEIHLSLQKLYNTFQQNRQYINNIVNKYTDNQVITNQIYNNINAENDKLLKNINNVLSLPSTNIKISDKKIQSLNKKKYGSTVKSNEIDNKISSIQTSYEDDTDDNLLNNLHKLVIYNDSLNKRQLEIKSKIYTIKQTVNDIAHSINEQRGQEKIQSLHTNLIITDIFSNFKNPKQKIALVQYTKGIFNNPRISKTYNTVLHTKETTDKIYELLKFSFSEKNIFAKLFGGITPDAIQNKIKDKEQKIKKDIFKNDNDVNHDEQTYEQQPQQKQQKKPWQLLGLLAALRKLLKKVRTKNKVRKRPKTKRAKAKTKGKNARKTLRAKGISKTDIKKFQKAFDDSYKKSLKQFDTAKQKFIQDEWKKILDDPNFRKLNPSQQLKFKKNWLKNINKQLKAFENVYHSNYKSVLQYTITNCDASNIISQSSNRLKSTQQHLSKLFGKNGDLWNSNTKIGKQFATKLRFSNYKLLRSHGIKTKNLSSLKRVQNLTNIHIKDMQKFIKTYEKSVKQLARLNKEMTALQSKLNDAKMAGDTPKIKKLNADIKSLDSKIKSIKLKKMDAEVNISHLHKKTTSIVRKYKSGLSQNILKKLKTIKISTSFKNAVHSGNTTAKKFGIRPKTNVIKMRGGKIFKVPKKMPTKVPVTRGAKALKMLNALKIPAIDIGINAGMQAISFQFGISDFKDSYKQMGMSDSDIDFYVSLKRQDFYGGQNWMKGEFAWNAVLGTNPLALLDVIGFLTDTDIKNPFTMTQLKNATKGQRQQQNENDPVWMLANPLSNIKSHKTRESKIEDSIKSDIIQGLIYISSNTIDKLEKQQMTNIDNMNLILKNLLSHKEQKTSEEYYKIISKDGDIYKFMTNSFGNILDLIYIAFNLEKSEYFADKIIPYISASCNSQWLPGRENLVYELNNNVKLFKEKITYWRNAIVNVQLTQYVYNYAKYGQKGIDAIFWQYIDTCKNNNLINDDDIKEIQGYLNNTIYKHYYFMQITLMIIYNKQIFLFNKLKNILNNKTSIDDNIFFVYKKLIFIYKKFIAAYLRCVQQSINKLTKDIQNTVNQLQKIQNNIDNQIQFICKITVYSIYVYILQILLKYFQLYCLTIPNISSKDKLNKQFSDMSDMFYLKTTDPRKR